MVNPLNQVYGIENGSAATDIGGREQKLLSAADKQ